MQCKSMKVKRRGLLAGACLAALLITGFAGSAYAADYTPVTDARLANPEPGNLADDPRQLQGLELQRA